MAVCEWLSLMAVCEMVYTGVTQNLGLLPCIYLVKLDLGQHASQFALTFEQLALAPLRFRFGSRFWWQVVGKLKFRS